MKTFSRLGIVIAALATLAFAVQDTISLVRQPKEGETNKYKIQATLQVMGAEVKFGANVIEKVTKVDDQGNYTVESTQTDVRIKFGEQEMAPPDTGLVVISKTTTLGQLLEMNGEGVDADALRRAHLTQITVPKDPVAVGHKWTTEVKASPISGQTPGAGEYSFTGLETVGGIESAVIKFSYKETSGTTPASCEGTAWISKKDGSMVKMQARYKNAPLAEAGGPVDMDVVVERL